MAQQRYRLKLSKLQFCSLVDDPAQPNAKLLAIKRRGKADEITATAKLAKLNDELGLAFFWAFTSTNPDGTDHFDLQGDTIDTDFIKAAMDFMLDGGGAVDEMHDGEATDGRVVFAFPMTPDIAKAFGVVTKQSGLMIAIKATDEQLAKLKDGTYTGVSIAGLGTREAIKSKPGRVCKGSLYTNEVDGHQHEIYCYEDGTFWVSYATAAGAENNHSHGIVFEDGKLVILADSGHAHELAEGQPGVAVVPADALVIVAARAPRATSSKSVAAKSTPSIAPHNMGSQPETTMDPKDQQIADLTKRAERAERIAKMSGAHKTHFDTLAGDDAEAFLSKSNAERESAVKAALEDDKPIWTGEVTKVAVRKRDGELALQLAKQNEANAAALAKREAEIEKADVRKCAAEVLGGAPGDDATHDSIIAALRKGCDAEQLEKALATLKGLKAASRVGKAAPGASGGAPEPGDALDAFNAGVKSYAEKHKIADEGEALVKYLGTSEGQALKRAYDQTRAYGKHLA